MVVFPKNEVELVTSCEKTCGLVIEAGNSRPRDFSFGSKIDNFWKLYPGTVAFAVILRMGGWTLKNGYHVDEQHLPDRNVTSFKIISNGFEIKIILF